MGPEWDFASPVPGIRPQARRLIRTLNVARGCYIKSLQAGIRSGLPGYERLKNAKTRTAKDHPVIDASGRDPDLRVRFPLLLIEKTDYSACTFPDSLDLRLTCV